MKWLLCCLFLLASFIAYGNEDDDWGDWQADDLFLNDASALNQLDGVDFADIAEVEWQLDPYELELLSELEQWDFDVWEDDWLDWDLDQEIEEGKEKYPPGHEHDWQWPNQWNDNNNNDDDDD